MSTKGASNRYGNSRGGYSKNNINGVNYEWARNFNKKTLDYHFERHGNEFNFSSAESYKQHAIKFANAVDKKNCKAYVDINGTTYKYNKKTRELVIVKKNGIIVTYYKVTDKFSYIDKRGVKRCIEIK